MAENMDGDNDVSLHKQKKKTHQSSQKEKTSNGMKEELFSHSSFPGKSVVLFTHFDEHIGRKVLLL